MSKFIAIMLSTVLFFSSFGQLGALPAQETVANTPDVTTYADDGKRVTNMYADQSVYITLAENTKWRWNANDSGNWLSVIHLDDADGKNRFFRLDAIEDGWYGIKHLKTGGTDYFVDVDGKSHNDGAVLHLYEDEDNKVKNDYHRQFGFYHAGTDAAGNKLYYIQNRNSGLWLGVQGNSVGEHAKIVQTSDDNRKAWIVTRSVVPLSGNEVQVLKGDDTKGYAEFYVNKSLEAINVISNIVTKNDWLHNFELGTSSKWLIRWNNTYQAYEIEYSAHREEGSTLVWDLQGESEQLGTPLNLWTRQSHSRNDNTTQFWRFLEQSDGTVYIQNAQNGRLISCSNDYDAELELSDSPLKYRISMLDGDTGSASKKSHYAYAEDWMADIPDNAYLSSVNIPATHDTGTAAIWQDGVPQFSFTSCQKLFFGEQLNVGARSFDIRCNPSSGATTPSNVKIIHGSELAQCYNRDESDLTLDDIFTESVSFLKQHPSESIILLIKRDAGTSENLARAVGSFIKDNQQYVWKGEGIPSMAEARGKIVLMRRYDIDTTKYDPADDELEIHWFGPYLKDWDNTDYGDQTHAVSIYNKDEIEVYVQDAYQENVGKKKEYIEGTFKQTTGRDSKNAIAGAPWIFNFTSSARGLIFEMGREINPWLYKDSGHYFSNQRLGMVMYNYLDAPLAEQIIETNTRAGMVFETKVDFPESFSLVYGQSIAEAEKEINDNNTQFDGTYRFEFGNYVPTWDDFESNKKYKLIFTPTDKRLKPVTALVKITQFEKKPVIVTIDDATITYGQSDPTLTYTFDEDELVGKDTPTDLKITLAIEDRLDHETPSGHIESGEYLIKGSSKSDMYDVSFETGHLKVKQKRLSVSWSDTSKLVYTGSPMNVTATLEGIETGDRCTAVVTGGDAVGPSWDGNIGSEPTIFTAEITELTGNEASNYVLPGYSLVKKYFIFRNTPNPDDYHFPEMAILEYGQSLDEADLVAASGNGEFRFVADGTGPIVDPSKVFLQAGEYIGRYTIAFIPAEQDESHPVTHSVTVIVNKKPITVQANHAVKTYGEATALDFSFDEGGLVGNDKKEDLGVTLSSKNGENASGDEKSSSAGLYTIEGTVAQNGNYEVSVEPAKLLIRRKPVTPVWPGNSQFTYSGSALNIVATVESDLLFGDTCTVSVYNGNGEDTGDYTAVAYSLSNPNYRLNLSSGAIAWAYTIGQAAPQVVFPTSASITYGQQLSDAVLSGQSGEGSFTFEDGTLTPTVAESGTLYNMTFTPNDSRNYTSVTQGVSVTVAPKTVVARADRKTKTYGEASPALSYSVDAVELVDGDKVDDLQIQATLTAGEGEVQDCDTGAYRIDTIGELTWNNENYKVDYEYNWLVVEPLELTVIWSDTSNLVYTGSPVAVTAELETLLYNDDCKAVVEGGNEVGPSWAAGRQNSPITYTAAVVNLTGADRFNYVVSENAETEREYLIKPAGGSDDGGTIPDTSDSLYVLPLIVLAAIGLCLLGAGSAVSLTNRRRMRNN